MDALRESTWAGTGEPAGAEATCARFEPHGDQVAVLRARVTEVAGLAGLFQALADETRTRILYLLSLSELCVCDLAAVLDLSLPAVSHHLRLLKAMRLVTSRREGRNVYYSLADGHVLRLIQVAQEHYAEER
ncbi:ArsR/SmtB family transcription factor [Thermaerobacter subterraneus]|uniref:Transcriptional regulator n=1 Tax=Thermaerobacter subterraneus DSM 13965 TaxID=867903 RepID=K6Q279_9FIRM|nr:metalloregulator ArsR/SmtB family transcription factor [Thermaerobacter subterraneus]EKP95089.1 putative transcriptional regulator [Thermaerobacter subterraneus DSM 13965]